MLCPVPNISSFHLKSWQRYTRHEPNTLFSVSLTDGVVLQINHFYHKVTSCWSLPQSLRNDKSQHWMLTPCTRAKIKDLRCELQHKWSVPYLKLRVELEWKKEMSGESETEVKNNTEAHREKKSASVYLWGILFIERLRAGQEVCVTHVWFIASVHKPGLIL